MDYKKIIEDMVNLIIKEGASDLHLSSGRNPIIRIAGNLIPLVKNPILTPENMKGFLGKFLSPENK